MAPTFAIALLSCMLSSVLATAPSKVRIAGRGHGGRRTGVTPAAQPAGLSVVPTAPMNGTGNFSLVWSTAFFDQWYTAASLTLPITKSSLPFMLTGGNW